MLEEFKNKYIKKSKSELEIDKIKNNMCNKLWKDSDYNTAYYLGAITQLKIIVESMRESDCLKRDDILSLIKSYKIIDNMPNEIKNLVDIILDEFYYKED